MCLEDVCMYVCVEGRERKKERKEERENGQKREGIRGICNR